VKKNGGILTNYGAADGCVNIVLVCMVQHKFPDAEMVGNAMARLLDVIERYELVGKWVSLVSNKEIREVSTFMHSLSSSLIRDL